MTDVSRVDYEALVDELMLSEFENSPNLLNLTKSFVAPVQALEDDLIAFMKGNGIYDAIGEMLDIIGSWMGVARQGRLDGEYRTAILGRALSDGMDGTTERFLAGFRAMIQSDQARFFNYYPNEIYAVAGTGWSNSLASELERIAPVTSTVHLVVAQGLEYLAPAVESVEQETLQTHTGEDYELVVDGVPLPWNVGVITSSKTFGGEGVLGWEGITLENEVPVAFEAVPFRIVSGTLVDQDGVEVTDDQGNLISVLEQVVI